MNVNFIGEHLLVGKVGQLCIVLAFGTSLFSAISYFFSVQEPLTATIWKKLARASYLVHVLAVLGIILSLFTIISSHYFEYHYAWEHSSRELPSYFIVSSFWEGQEGSFLLWSFWHIVIGSILIFKSGKWESPVMAVICLSQVFICSMLLGVDILGFQIGSSPFILTRNVMSEAPIFQDALYLTKFLTDGRGLNPLLQNYWMVIHPPMLFFGFASMVVPFAYAIAGLWTRQYKEWIKPAQVWSLVAVMILGTAIMMGSAWAYEALSFGGFWQWDPVENASLIPWITLIAAVHVMISYRSTGNSYVTSLILVLVSYVLVLYASYLTRSGVLQNASVHAFTDLGMSQQLLSHVVIFIGISVGIVVLRWKELPFSKKEESTYSREFWMFIGAMVLSLSCVQIIATTSIPVVNAFFHTNLAPPVDLVGHYNKWQLPFAILITIFSGFAQFLKYKKTDPAKFIIRLLISGIISILFTAVLVYLTVTYKNIVYILFIYACVFSIVSNANILNDAFQGKMKLVGSAIAHIGFALLLIGALVAASGRRVISVNTSGTDFPDFDARGSQENIMLLKGAPYQMGEYSVTYLSDSVSGPNTYYRVNYLKTDATTGNITENFDLYPNGQVNEKMGGLIASPATRHYNLYDVYTHVSSVPTNTDMEKRSNDSSYTNKIMNVSLGDTIPFKGGVILVKDLNRNATIKNIRLDASKKELAVGLNLVVISRGRQYKAEPIFLVKDNNMYDIAAGVDQLGLRFHFSNILPAQGKFVLDVMQKKDRNRDWIIMKAMIFPYINFLWGGIILMVTGFMFSIFRRNKELKPEIKPAV